MLAFLPSFEFIAFIVLLALPVFIYKVVRLFFDITLCSPPEDESN